MEKGSKWQFPPPKSRSGVGGHGGDDRSIAACTYATASSRIFAACDLLGPAGETSVFVPARSAAKRGVSVTLIHHSLARSLPIEERDRAAAALSELGIHLLSAENIHGKFMTWDEDALLITSFNWLATSPDPWKPRGAEIGIIVKGPGLAEKLQTQFCQLAGIELPSAGVHHKLPASHEGVQR